MQVGSNTHPVCASHSDLQMQIVVTADLNSKALGHESSITVKDPFLNLNYPGAEYEKDRQNSQRYICSLAKAVNYIIIAMLLNLELRACIVAVTTEKKTLKR